MSYRSLGSDEVILRNCRPVGRPKGNMSLSDPLAAGVVVDLHKPGLSGIQIRLPRRRLIFGLYFIKKKFIGTCRFNRRERQIVISARPRIDLSITNSGTRGPHVTFLTDRLPTGDDKHVASDY